MKILYIKYYIDIKLLMVFHFINNNLCHNYNYYSNFNIINYKLKI